MAASSAPCGTKSRRSASPSKRPPNKPRKGRTQPRIFTPPLRKLTRKTTYGYSVIEFAETVLGVTLYPWQKWLLIHALELNRDGSFRFRTVVVLVARQNGKSTLSQVLALWTMFVLERKLVIGTAQDLDIAEGLWQECVDLVQETPDLALEVRKVVQTNGKKRLQLSGNRVYKVKAANRAAGRSLAADLVMLDELREHQTFDAYGALSKTMMARKNAQLWAFSNAGDESSVVLHHLRYQAHMDLGDPDGLEERKRELEALEDRDEWEGDAEDWEEWEEELDTDDLGLFEWSAPPGCSKTDRDGWEMANPSMGYGHHTERAVASACKTDPEWMFRIEVLCQWSEGKADGPFPSGRWEDCLDEKSRIPKANPIGIGIDTEWDRSRSYIAVAGLRKDELVHVEVAATGPGTDWVIPWLTAPERSQRIKDAVAAGRVTLQFSGAPASSLVDKLRAAKVELTEWKGPDLGRATGDFYDLVRSRKLRHLPQPALDRAAATGVLKPLGDSKVWNRKGSSCAAIVAATGAAWLVSEKPAPATKTPQIHDWPEDLLAEFEGAMP